jgi:hypothetical protein
VILADAVAANPEVKITNCAVWPSNMAAWGLPSSGRTRPTGTRDSGGETAGRAGSIVGGAPWSVLDEQPTTNVSKTNRPAACR